MDIGRKTEMKLCSRTVVVWAAITQYRKMGDFRAIEIYFLTFCRRILSAWSSPGESPLLDCRCELLIVASLGRKQGGEASFLMTLIERSSHS